MLPIIKTKNTMIKDYRLIEQEIKKELNINIYEDSRKRPIVTARTLFIYILRKDWNFTLHKILDIFKQNGKDFTHATLIHNIKLYEITKREEPKLEEIRGVILNEEPLQFEVIQMIKNVRNKEKLEQIKNCIEFNQ